VNRRTLSGAHGLNIPGNQDSPLFESQWEACVTSSHQLHPACTIPAFLQYNVSLINKVWPPRRSAGFPAKNRISTFEFCGRHRQSPTIPRTFPWDGICSIIYKIIMGIELYNNNGRSISIIFYTLHRGLLENLA
jgi:hypothetical protein